MRIGLAVFPSVEVAQLAVELIVRRGFHRDRDLAGLLDEFLDASR